MNSDIEEVKREVAAANIRAGPMALPASRACPFSIRLARLSRRGPPPGPPATLARRLHSFPANGTPGVLR